MKHVTKNEFIRKMLDVFGPNGEHWTQRYEARDINGNYTKPYSDDAYSFCYEGCIQRVEFLFKKEGKCSREAARQIDKELHDPFEHLKDGWRRMIVMNDLGTFSDIKNELTGIMDKEPECRNISNKIIEDALKERASELEVVA